MRGASWGQIKTMSAYLFVVLIGSYIGYQSFGVAGLFVGAIVSLPAAILIGLGSLILLAELLGYDSPKRASSEGEP